MKNMMSAVCLQAKKINNGEKWDYRSLTTLKKSQLTGKTDMNQKKYQESITVVFHNGNNNKFHRCWAKFPATPND